MVFKQYSKNICLSIGSILVVLAIFEIVLRLTGYYPAKMSIAPPYLFANHAKTWWALRPNFTTTVRTPDGVVTYKINAQGIRSSYDISQKALTPRIFIIGDSYTFGVGVNEEIAFPRVLDTVLKQQGLNTTIVNLGVAGFGTFHSYERLREYAELLGMPQIVVYMFHLNDPVDNIAGKKEVVYGIRIDAHRKYKRLLAVIGHSYHLSRSIAFLFDRLYDTFFNPRRQKILNLEDSAIDIYDREDFQSTVKYLSELITWTSQRNIRLLVVTTDYSHYSDPLKTFLNDHHVPMIEGGDIFARLNADKLPIRLIEGHWNQQGHKLIAQGIAEYLLQEKWLENKKADSKK
jgi:lysophospholipase L1-like esterase